MSKLNKFIVDKNGQWAHPGKPTMIPDANGNITMEGVPYPVYGIDDQGNAMMMMPGGQYRFPGNDVYEIPMVKSGGDISIPNLKPTSWLDKYDEGGPGPVNTLNPDNRVYTYKTDPEFFDNQAVYHDNPKASDVIRKRVYSGEWGYNPVTQTLEKLSKDNQTVVSEETKALSKDKRTKPSVPPRDDSRKPLTYEDLRRVEPLNLPAESTSVAEYDQQAKAVVDAFEKRKELKPEIASKKASMPGFGSAIGSYITPEEKEKRAQADLLYKQYKPETTEQVKQLQLDMINKGFLSNEKTSKGIYKEMDGKFGDRTKMAYEKYLNEEFRPKSNLDLSSELSRTECGLEGCAEYVSSVTRPNSWVLGDAWTMNDYITSHGGRNKYNIYANSAFKNVDNEKDLVSTTRKVKANNKASAEMFAVGDVVGLFNPNSSYHGTALKEGKGTYNTHVGIVTAIKDGVPIISHNIKGQLHHDNYNNLTIGWISEPPQKKVYRPSSPAETIEDKINVYSKDLTELFAPGMDPTLVAKTVKGILTKETNLGQTRTTNAGLRETARGLLGESTDPSDISRGIGKLKTSTLPGDIKEFLEISDVDDVTDDAGVKGAIYKYIEGYKFFDDYRKKNPKLGLTDEDVRNMAILSYNQGYAKLSNLGYNNPTMTPAQEVAKLRELYEGNVKDVTSTNWKYIPKIGEKIYDYEYPEGHPSYIKKVNEYANRKYGGWLQKYQGNEGSSQVKPTSNFTLPSLDPQAQQSADYNKGWEDYNAGVRTWTELLQEKEEKKGRALTTDEKQRWLQKAVKRNDGRKTAVDPNDPKWNFLFKESYQTWDPELGPMTVMSKPVDVTYQMTDLDKEKARIATETRKAEMTPFAKSLGMKETDLNVQKRASQNANDQVALRILNDKPQGDRNRVEWLNTLTPEERSTIERSQYAGKLDPDFTSQFSQGLEKNLRNVANIAAVGPIDWYQGNNVINQPLWTNSDYTQEEAANASAMGVLAPLSYPTNLVTGAITGDFGSALQGQKSMPLFTDYRQPEFASTMSGLSEAIYDPLNAVGIGIMEKVPVGKMTSQLAAKQARNFNKFLTSKEGQFYKPKFGTLDVTASPEELKRLAEIDEASSINAYNYRPNDSALSYDELRVVAEQRRNEAAKNFLQKSKYLGDDEIRQIFGKSKEEILQYKPELPVSKPVDSAPRGTINLARPSRDLVFEISRSGDPAIQDAARNILTSFDRTQAEDVISNISSPMWRDRLREYATTFYPEMAQVDESAQAANQLPPPPENVYLDLDGNNITPGALDRDDIIGGYQSGSYAAERAAEDLPSYVEPLPELSDMERQLEQDLLEQTQSFNYQQPTRRFQDIGDIPIDNLSLTGELRNIPRNIKGMFNLAEKHPDRLATPALYAQSYSTPREMLTDVTDKLNDTILNADAGQIITGSTNTSHNSFLVQMDYIAKNAGKEDLSEPIFLGYRSMNDAGFLSQANIPKTDIINYINSNLNKIQKKRGVNFNFGDKPTYMDEYGNIMIPQYGVKKITPKGEFTGIKKKDGGSSKYQDGGDMPFDLPLRSANPGSPWAYESPQANGYILPDVNRPQLLNTGATEYKMGVDDNVTIPTVVNGQYMSPDDAYARYILTGEQFKPMVDPHSYSAFYDTVGPLGLMKQKKGGNPSKNQYINSVTLSNKSSWLNKYK